MERGRLEGSAKVDFLAEEMGSAKWRRERRRGSTRGADAEEEGAGQNGNTLFYDVAVPHSSIFGVFV